jgi:hypothetical protein
MEGSNLARVLEVLVKAEQDFYREKWQKKNRTREGSPHITLRG